MNAFNQHGHARARDCGMATYTGWVWDAWPDSVVMVLRCTGVRFDVRLSHSTTSPEYVPPTITLGMNGENLHDNTADWHSNVNCGVLDCGREDGVVDVDASVRCSQLPFGNWVCVSHIMS